MSSKAYGKPYHSTKTLGTKTKFCTWFVLPKFETRQENL